MHFNQVWKSQKKSHKRATFTFWVDIKKCQKKDQFCRVFDNLNEACGQTVLPVLKGQKLSKNIKIKNFKCDILSNFQTMCASSWCYYCPRFSAFCKWQKRDFQSIRSNHHPLFDLSLNWRWLEDSNLRSWPRKIYKKIRAQNQLKIHPSKKDNLILLNWWWITNSRLLLLILPKINP